MVKRMRMRKQIFSEFLLAGLVLCCAGSGCSIRRYALNQAADVLAQSGATFASDDDPELIKAAAPFSLKLRSEERRVGKECTAVRSGHREKKKRDGWTT